MTCDFLQELENFVRKNAERPLVAAFREGPSRPGGRIASKECAAAGREVAANAELSK